MRLAKRAARFPRDLHVARPSGADHHGLEGKPERPAEMADRKLTRMTPKEIKAQLARRTPRAVAEARKRYDETTEEDIRRHMREDGYDPEREPSGCAAHRASQVGAGKAPDDPGRTGGASACSARNAAQLGAEPLQHDPAVQALLLVLYREPEAALARAAPCCLIPGVGETAATFLAAGNAAAGSVALRGLTLRAQQLPQLIGYAA